MENDIATKLTLIAKRSIQNPQEKFTSLQHLLKSEYLAECYQELKKDKAAGVDGKTILLDMASNSIGGIREIIKSYHRDGLKAALMIGEDIKTALSVEGGDRDAPSVIPWQELNQDISYAKFPLNNTNDITFNLIPQNATAKEINNILNPQEGVSVILGGVSTYQAEILTSLLYPISSDQYTIKRDKIIKALNKFTDNRKTSYGNKIEVFEDNDPNIHAAFDWDSFSKLGNIQFTKNCENCLVNETNQYKLFMARGHALPSFIQIGRNMMASEVKKIRTPFFMANGCYVQGWFSAATKPNGKLDPPNRTSEIFIEQIFDSNYLRIMLLGTESSDTSYKKFIDALNNNKTIAEAYLLEKNPMASTFYGDPTFRFN